MTRRAELGAGRAWSPRVLAAALAALALLAGCTGGTPEPPDAADEPTGASPPAAEATPPPAVEAPDEDEAEAGEEPVEAAPPVPPVPPGRDELAARLQQLVDEAVAEAAPTTIALIVTDEHGRELAAHEPDTPVLPASTLKTVTAAAVLSTLGPDVRLATIVETTAPIDADGVVDGDLLLVGSGDPTLGTPEYGRWVYPARPRTPLDALADQLVGHGLRHVTGSVMGLPDGFVGEPRAEGWRDRYFSDFDARHVAGLTVDAGLVTILRYPSLKLDDDRVAALEDAGADPDDLEGIGLDSLRELVDDLDVDDELAEELLDLEPDELGPPQVRVDVAADPSRHAAAELVRLLEEREVVVDGEPRVGTVDAPVVGRLAKVESAPLEELLRFAVQRSDNHLTDQLFQVIGRVRTGEGSWQRGERALRQFLDRFGIDHTGAVFADGSGLSRDDRVTARLLVDVDRAMTSSRHGEVWTSLMAVMGESGTLQQRLRGTPAVGRFVGKTGTLADVTALSGAVTDGDGVRYHLAMLANDAAGEGRWVARALVDELILQLVADLDA